MKSHENNPNRVNKVHETSFWHFIQERLLEVARFPREELGEKCEKHILQEIAEETKRRARFSGQLRERFTVGTEIEEYRSIKCWHRNRGVLLHKNRGEVRPSFNAVRLHLFAQKSRSTACYFAVQLH